MAFGFLKDLFDRFSGKPVDWDELEESLIRADIGVPMTLEIIKALQERPDVSAKEIVSVVKQHIGSLIMHRTPAAAGTPASSVHTAAQALPASRAGGTSARLRSDTA